MHQQVVGDLHGISQPTVSRCINDMTKALLKKTSQLIRIINIYDNINNKFDTFKNYIDYIPISIYLDDKPIYIYLSILIIDLYLFIYLL